MLKSTAKEPWSMSQLITRTARLLPYAKRAKAMPSFATAYDYEPDAIDAPVLGSLFIVIEVLTATKQAEEVADLIIKTVGEAYYNLPAEDETNEPKLADAYTRFERAVRAVNHQLSDYTNQGNAGWVGRLSSVVAVHAGDQIHITQTGSASGYLYRHGTASHMTEDMTGRGPHRPASTFNSIASGHLEPQDHLLLATPALFHQINKSQLENIIADSSPQMAVSKLSELISDTPNADRVAALLVEVTTPDALAQQRGADPVEEPDTVKVGQPESPLAGMKEAAAPAVAKGLTKARKASGQAIFHAKHTILPKARELSGQGLQRAKKIIKNRQHRSKLYIAAALGAVLIAGFAYSSLSTGAIDNLVKRYDADYAQVQTAKEQLAAGNRVGARQTLEIAQKDLNNLGGLAQAKLLEQRLQKRAHPEDDPASVSGLKAEIAALIDQIDGLVTVAPQDLADFDSIKNAKITFMDIVAGKVYLSEATGSVYIYDPASDQIVTGASNPNGVGKVVATTASSAGDGIYLLTEEPAVWFFKADSNQLTRQTISPGEWPKGKSLASYNNNLYILAADSTQIYRHLKTVGGFGARGNYLSGDGAALLGNSTSLTIDGLVYTAGVGGLKRFNGGKLEKGLSLPEPLSHPVSIDSLANGDLLLITDSQSGRVGLIDASADLAINKQIKLSGNPKLHIARYDAKTRQVIALSDGKLIKFSLPQ